MNSQLPSIEETSTGRRSRPFVRLFGLLLIVIAVAAGVYLIVAYFAWENGQSLRQVEAETQRTEQITHQIELAQQDIGNSSYNLALRRLEWVLQQEPGNPNAQALQQQVLAQQEATAAPPTSDATEEPEATISAADATPQAEPLPELQRMRRLAEAEQWEELLPALLDFQREQPGYERTETDQILFDTYVNLGLAYLDTEKVELGLNYLSQAEALGNLPQEALDYRLWANLYLQGMSYYGVNWDIAASNFRDLCISAPFYHNACGLLQESLINYGNQWAFALEWCSAEVAYQEAWQYERSETLGNKLSQARDSCLNATPTPSAVITGTLPITGTDVITP